MQAPAISLFGTTYKEEGPSVSRYTILRPNRSVPTVIIQATHTCFFCFFVFVFFVYHFSAIPTKCTTGTVVKFGGFDILKIKECAALYVRE